MGFLRFHYIPDNQSFNLRTTCGYIWFDFSSAAVASILQNGRVLVFHKLFALHNGNYVVCGLGYGNRTSYALDFVSFLGNIYILELECACCICSKNECVTRWLLKWREQQCSTKNELWRRHRIKQTTRKLQRQQSSSLK